MLLKNWQSHLQEFSTMTKACRLAAHGARKRRIGRPVLNQKKGAVSRTGARNSGNYIHKHTYMYIKYIFEIFEYKHVSLYKSLWTRWTWAEIFICMYRYVYVDAYTRRWRLHKFPNIYYEYSNLYVYRLDGIISIDVFAAPLSFALALSFTRPIQVRETYGCFTFAGGCV